MQRCVLAVTGLSIEARIARGPGVLAVCGGGDHRSLAAKIEDAIANGAAAIMSFGIAGALEPSLAAGTCVIARSVIDGDTSWPVDTAWSDAIAVKLTQAIRADIAGVDQVLGEVSAKRALFVRSGAATVDMESHIAARAAAEHGLPFAALRVICDPALRALPRAAAYAMRADGSVDVTRVLKSLLKDPAQLPLLARAALDGRIALRELRRGRRRLGDRLGFLDFDQLALDVL